MKKRLPLLWLWLLTGCVLPISQVRAQTVRAATWTWARNLGMQGEARVAATSRAGFYATGRQLQRRLWEHDTLPEGSDDHPISYLIRHADRDAASWVRILPGASRDVAADERGNVYVLGSFDEPTLPAAPVPPLACPGIVPPPTAHRQVLRYDSQGQLRGDLTVAGDVVAFAVNGRGQLAVLHCLVMPPPAALSSDSAAQGWGSADDERGSLHLSCFGPDGQRQWTRLVTDTYASLSDLGNPSPDQQRAVGIDRQGRVWLTGRFEGTLNRSAGRFLTDTAHTSTGFLLGYGPQGQLARALPLPHTAPTALAVTPAGTVYLVGTVDSAAAPLPDRRQPPGSGSRLQCRSASGGLRWVSPVPWDASALALDRRGRAYVLGNKDAETTDSSGWLVAARGRRGPDVWVARYSRRGRLQRALRGTGLNDETGTSLAVDGAGAGWVAGRINPYPLKKESCTSFGAYAFDTEEDYAQDFHLVYDSVGQAVASRRISPLPSPNYEQLRADKTINPDDYAPGARQPEDYELAQAACRESHHSPQFTERYASHYRLRGRGLSLSAPVVADAAGNSYALCALEGETALKGLASPLVDQSPDAPDGVLLKYGPGGQLRWARQLAATSPEVALNQLAVDGQGNVFVLGRAKGQAALGGHPLGPLWRQASQPVLAKYDSVGRLAWLRTDQLGLDSRCTLSALAPDGRGGLYSLGWSDQGEASNGEVFGPRRMARGAAGQSSVAAYLVAFDTAGTVRWLRTLRPDSTAELEPLLSTNPADASATLALGVYSRGWPDPSDRKKRRSTGPVLTLEAGPAGTPPAQPALDSLGCPMFLARYTADGRLRWVRPADAERAGPQRRTVDWSAAATLATDAAGNSYLNGVENGQPSGERLARPLAVLASFDPMGQPRWLRRCGSHHLTSVVPGRAGTYYLAGTDDDQCQPSLGKGHRQVWVTAYTADGQVRWNRTSSGENQEASLGLNLDGRCRLHQTCQFMPVAPVPAAHTNYFGVIPLNDVFMYIQKCGSCRPGDYSSAYLAGFQLGVKGRKQRR